MTDNFASTLHRRITSALQAGRGDADALGGQVRVNRYTDEAVARQEQRLLRQHPQPVAASSSLASPGAWLSLTHADIPLLLVRQESGQAQAFVNVCRHRGARVVPEGSGSEARAFVCPYHAWTYRPDGALQGVPAPSGFPCLQQETSGLRRLATVERAGIVWVILDPALSASDPGAHLGELMDEHPGSLMMVFAAYNAGGHRVKQWIAAYGDPRKPGVDPIDWVERIPFTETRNYVQRVAENLAVYRALLKEDAVPQVAERELRAYAARM